VIIDKIYWYIWCC